MKKNPYNILHVLLYSMIIYFNAPLAAESINIHTLEKILNEIPKSDLKEIKDLFEHIFKYNELAFTLLGDKPMSFSPLPRWNPTCLLSDKLICSYCSYLFDFEKNYAKNLLTWKKYAYLFKIKSFIFKEDSVGMVLMNKKKISEVVLDNKSKFYEIFGNGFDLNEFISEMEIQPSIFDFLKQNHEIFGILLGFEKHNSGLFQQREDMLSILEPYKIPIHLENTLEASTYFPNMRKEVDVLWQTLPSLNPSDRYFPIVNQVRVGFSADPNHIETKILRKKYEKQRQIINKFYSEENWFEKTLLHLLSCIQDSESRGSYIKKGRC